MATSLYDISVRSYLQILGGLSTAMQKGAAHAAENNIDMKELINFRLRDDMLPFKFQVIATCHQSLGCLKGLRTGSFAPPPDMPDIDYAGLQQLVSETIEELGAMTEGDINALSNNDVIFKMGSMELPFQGEDFILSFSLPNFYFHATTTYDMLRIKGTPLGKLDFLGAVRFKG
jgi:hypothetical protein